MPPGKNRDHDKRHGTRKDSGAPNESNRQGRFSFREKKSLANWKVKASNKRKIRCSLSEKGNSIYRPEKLCPHG